jgi:hypothetical protein
VDHVIHLWKQQLVLHILKKQLQLAIHNFDLNYGTLPVENDLEHSPNFISAAAIGSLIVFTISVDFQHEPSLETDT